MNEHEQMVKYIRSGQEPEKRMTSKNGVMLPESLAREIFRVAARRCPLSKLASRSWVTALKSKVPFLVSNAELKFLSEGESFEPDHFEIGDHEFLLTKKLGGIVKISEELLMDSAVDIFAIIADAFGVALGETLEDAFINGDGAKGPTGFVHDSDRVTAAGANIAYTDLEKMFRELKAEYLPNASWLLSRQAFLDIGGMGDTNGNPVMVHKETPEGPDGYILGKPCFISLLPEWAPVAFGDFAHYQVLEQPPVIRRLHQLYALDGFVGFRLSQHLDAKLIKPDAILALEL